MSSQYNVLDIFAGAGGLGEGFSNLFNIVSHIEMNKYAVKSLETRMLYHSFVNVKKKIYIINIIMELSQGKSFSMSVNHLVFLITL